MKTDVTLLPRQLFRFENMGRDSLQLEYFTGLSKPVWDCVWKFLRATDWNVMSEKNFEKMHGEGHALAGGSGQKSKLSLQDQLLLTLMRLCLGRMGKELSYHFGIDEATVSRILKTRLNFLYLHLGLIPIWPKWERVVEGSMSDVFRSTHPNTFIIIDATELRCAIPSSLPLRSQRHSSYKSHTTVKGTVGIAPNASSVFISQLFTG